MSLNNKPEKISFLNRKVAGQQNYLSQKVCFSRTANSQQKNYTIRTQFAVLHCSTVLKNRKPLFFAHQLQIRQVSYEVFQRRSTPVCTRG